ncbi:Gfo/Idh/MocA family oxidoreductase [Staphylococcus gallinarum]|uniref:Gfo/Idh/MocA family protein n=1 Tax=Staphylococcus gallinarum TaxID=1293 RepID=UPI002DBF96C0|nr:Gfo/Idh/MocA family oxidoreductase [Staphylococcus gallinarum]MEB6241885.1 Gfo/Idh/MocA family oxidoreductase [Staphylococcus gallinarum]MEB6295062.1 Gfo/Idh/MocA family oxidoreductase [Staphylococcus gallinarum]
MLNIGIVGLGDVSNIHIQAINNNPHAQIIAVCDSDQSLKHKVPEVPFYEKLQDMLNYEDLDCVHICLPHYLHLFATRQCVEQGVHVLQEKPLALNAREGSELLELEKAYPHIKIGICFQNRYNKTFQTLQKIVESNIYGPIKGIKALVTWSRPNSYYTDKPWRGELKHSGGGVLINQAIHTLDLMQLLGGSMNSIRGNTTQLLDYNIEVEDTASANIIFNNKAHGLFFATNASISNSSIELQVIFEHEKLTIKDNILTRVNSDNIKEQIAADDIMPGTKSYYGPSHGKLIDHFYNCIDYNLNHYIHVEDAITANVMIDAIVKSSHTNQTVMLNE